MSWLSGHLNGVILQTLTKLLVEPASSCKRGITHTPSGIARNLRQWRAYGRSPSRAVATGVYRDIYPPNQSTLNFLCGCFVSLQWLVNIYTHANQIPGYAFDCIVFISLDLLYLHCALIRINDWLFDCLFDWLTGQYRKDNPCPAGYRRCPRNYRCVPQNKFCDGQNDCRDGSDEEPQYCSCKAGDFTCANHHCIPMRSATR